MKIITIIYIAYIWVGLLHALFVGVTLYTFMGAWLKRQFIGIPLAIIFFILAFFELYWIPIFQSLGVKIYTTDNNIHQFFNIDAQTNLVNILRPNFISFCFWIASTFLAYKVGNYIFIKNCQSSRYE
jgi:hypothetical protein